MPDIERSQPHGLQSGQRLWRNTDFEFLNLKGNFDIFLAKLLVSRCCVSFEIISENCSYNIMLKHGKLLKLPSVALVDLIYFSSLCIFPRAFKQPASSSISLYPLIYILYTNHTCTHVWQQHRRQVQKQRCVGCFIYLHIHTHHHTYICKLKSEWRRWCECSYHYSWYYCYRYFH